MTEVAPEKNDPEANLPGETSMVLLPGAAGDVIM